MKRLTVALAAASALLITSGAGATTIIDDWANVKAPPAPTLAKDVKLDPKTTALLLLDFVKQTCNTAHNPDCIASLPGVIAFAGKARSAGAKIVYSITSTSTVTDISPGLEPRKGEPHVQSGADKFFKTRLDEILKKDGIKTVIITGTRSQGAILATATEAAYRGYKVVVPVDGQSSDLPYAKQYTVWDLVNAPGMPGNVVETTLDDIAFGH